ncbi:MAG: type II toxin-antitoxin system Phd/YefM family antitoxin [Solirubrobacterales bacterium]
MRPEEAKSSSTEEVAGSVIAVAAHQFRNHFGRCIEQAAAGAEVLVSRHGSPIVRLVGST